MYDNDQIRLMDMQPYRIYTITSGEGYSESLHLFRSEGAFYYANSWTEKGMTRYAEPGDKNQYMARALACIAPSSSLRDVCDEFLDLYQLWADLSIPTPKGFSVFETDFTPAQLCSLGREEKLIVFEQLLQDEIVSVEGGTLTLL